MKGLILLLALCGTAVGANSYPRPPQPYELQGVKLRYDQMPGKCWGKYFNTGWRLRNPDNLGRTVSDWFSCRIQVDPLTKTLTILTAVECEEQ